MKSEIRHGGILYPVLFNIMYVDPLISVLNACDLGCHIYRVSEKVGNFYDYNNFGKRGTNFENCVPLNSDRNCVETGIKTSISPQNVAALPCEK